MTAPEQLALDGPTDAARDLERWAHLSDDGVYRYILGRRWADGPLVGWVMLNPSTADATVDDPTIRRCCGFARTWGYAGILVGNLFAYRATDPRDLRAALDSGADAQGPSNGDRIREIAGLCPTVVCAWGAHPAAAIAAEVTKAWLHESTTRVACLGRTKAGHPRHPLYVPASQLLEDYR